MLVDSRKGDARHEIKAVRLLTWLIPVMVAICPSTITAQTAFGWTHNINNFDATQGQDYTCGYNTSVPCLYWPEPNHVSATLYAFYDPSISNVGPTHYNFNTTVSNSLGYWNAVQGAFNPLVYNCNYSGCHDVITYQADDLGADGTWALTYWGDFGSVQYSNGQYYAILNSTITTFNTEVSWNNSFQFGTLQADARLVATHETGHAEGLGHTYHYAVMHIGAENFYTPQADDINGMQSIYTGYIPA